MIKCAELNKEFATKREMFTALLESKDAIIKQKTSTIKNSEAMPFVSLHDGSASKGIEGLEEGFIYPIINTTKYMDSHNDVHFDGIWNKSAKEQKNKIFYLVDHSVKVGNVIAYPKDVDIMLKDVEWRAIGKDYDGTTQALIFKTNIFDYSNADAKKVVDMKLPAENSVSMQYVKISLAINDDGDEFKDAKKYYDKKIDLIANKEVAEDMGYFWGVEEARIYMEGSMVLMGSNDATPIVYVEPSDDTHKEEPAEVTLEEIKQIINKELN